MLPITTAAIAMMPAISADKAPAAFPVEVAVVAEEVELPVFEIDEIVVVIETTGEEVGAAVTIESLVVVAESVESPVVFALEEEVVSTTAVVDAAILPLGPHPGM